MIDEISSESKQDYIYASFDQISADTLIVIKDQDDKAIAAYKTGRSIKTLVYSESSLDYQSFKIYTGGNITGEETNGLYTSITSYSSGTEVSYNSLNGNNMNNKNDNGITNKNNFILKLLIGECSLLGVVLLIIVLIRIIKKNKTQEI